jgi:hypothetical protein
MTNPSLAHPSEEALERFLLHRSDESELESLETHILACESCITRLEALELQISDLKRALAGLEQIQIENEPVAAPSFWQRWLTIPNLSWAGAACAAIALAVTVVPLNLRHAAQPAEAQLAGGAISNCAASSSSNVNLATCRGMETAAFPHGRPLDLRIDTTDIAQGLVDVQVVDGTGSEIWQGQTEVQNERAAVRLPRISQPGPYFVRFYAPSVSAEHELLREFRFEIK